MSKEAMKLALETAEGIVNADWRKWDELASPAEFERWAKSRANFMANILREALAEQPAQQEPVKVGRITGNIKEMILRQEVMLYTDDYLPIGTALYTSPPAQRTWVGLTYGEVLGQKKDDPIQFYRAIEAKLKEKNNG